MVYNNQHSFEFNIRKELFFENFDDPGIKERVDHITISLIQKEQGAQYVGFGIDAPALSLEEINKVFEHYMTNYGETEKIFQLIGRELKERFQEPEERLPEAKKKRSEPER